MLTSPTEEFVMRQNRWVTSNNNNTRPKNLCKRCRRNAKKGTCGHTKRCDIPQPQRVFVHYINCCMIGKCCRYINIKKMKNLRPRWKEWKNKNGRQQDLQHAISVCCMSREQRNNTIVPINECKFGFHDSYAPNQTVASSYTPNNKWLTNIKKHWYYS